ncbi:hypothetical protein [Polyangium jinanense]|uniref:Uncharacterized protein n=1 Tax=Polyangium jinanense TaxID=2829994 RepID=A0A9X3X3F9_9BACT|nr:hypothetical protein [Polyangium jinanense]MDC3956156.1 hypothetical protein [Polyangium jinanense]MDC3983009.1 hypothetical protein [Polyangium jinanense]
MQGDLDFGTRSRVLGAICAFALALFLLALAFGIVSAPFHMHPVLAALLKGFIVLLFGSIGAFLVSIATQTLTGTRAKTRDVPDEALAHCLTCGERTPNDAVCPVCGEPPCDRSHAFSVNKEGWAGSAFGIALFGALLCLGLFVLIGPYHDGERRVWVLLACGALGLLLLAVGGAGVVGAILVLWGALGGESTLQYTVTSTEWRASGSGAASWGKLIWLSGHARVVSPLSPSPRSEGGYRVSPGDIEFAEMVATLDAAGIVHLADVTTYDFLLGDKPANGARPRARRNVPLPFTRTKNRSLRIRLAPVFRTVTPEGEYDDGLSDVYVKDELLASEPRNTVSHFFAQYLLEEADVRKLRHRLDEDPVHRAQAITHAHALRESGIVVAQELVDAVLGALGDANANPKA